MLTIYNLCSFDLHYFKQQNPGNSRMFTCLSGPFNQVLRNMYDISYFISFNLQFTWICLALSWAGVPHRDIVPPAGLVYAGVGLVVGVAVGAHHVAANLGQVSVFVTIVVTKSSFYGAINDF